MVIALKTHKIKIFLKYKALFSSRIVFFLGIFAVAPGSAYYHWRPNSQRLVWDRLPMTVGFMSLYFVVLDETIGSHSAKAVHSPFLESISSCFHSPWLLVTLIVTGLLSILYWVKNNDLRPYIIVQFYTMLSIPLLLLLFPSAYIQASSQYSVSLFLYLLAKVQKHAFRFLRMKSC